MNQREALLARLDALQGLFHKQFESTMPQPDLLQRFGNVTIHQMGALRHLKGGPLTMNELATRLEIGPSSATQLVDRLVQHGLAERFADPEDRRVQRVKMTPTAADITKRFIGERNRRLKVLLNPLTDTELETFVSLAERMLSGANAMPAVP